MYIGGPKDGQNLEAEHHHADEVQVSVVVPGETAETSKYLPDAFGNMRYTGQSEDHSFGVTNTD